MRIGLDAGKDEKEKNEAWELSLSAIPQLNAPDPGASEWDGVQAGTPQTPASLCGAKIETYLIAFIDAGYDAPRSV